MNKTPMYLLTHRRFSFANLVQANNRAGLSCGRIVNIDIDSDFDFFFVFLRRKAGIFDHMAVMRFAVLIY